MRCCQSMGSFLQNAHLLSKVNRFVLGAQTPVKHKRVVYSLKTRCASTWDAIICFIQKWSMERMTARKIPTTWKTRGTDLLLVESITQKYYLFKKISVFTFHITVYGEQEWYFQQVGELCRRLLTILWCFRLLFCFPLFKSTCTQLMIAFYAELYCGLRNICMVL